MNKKAFIFDLDGVIVDRALGRQRKEVMLLRAAEDRCRRVHAAAPNMGLANNLAALQQYVTQCRI